VTQPEIVQESDLVVVGGGLVGLSLALALLQGSATPLRLALIDRQLPQVLGPSAPERFDARVVALNAASHEFLSALGVWPGIERLAPYTAMQVWDGEGTGSIDFSAQDMGQDHLGQIVENRLLLSALAQRLAAMPGYQPREAGLVQLQAEADGQWRLRLDDGRSLRTPLVLAADGAKSLVREQLGFKLRQWSYGQTALVSSVRTAQPHRSTAYQRFSHQGPLAFLPLPHPSGCYSSIVWSLDEAPSAAAMALQDADFCEALGAALEFRLGPVLACEPRLALPLHQCHARRYVAPGAALLGDAAHAIHPLAGQGVNLGLADVAALVEELLRGQARRLPLHHTSLLERYERRRMPENLAAMAAMEAFKRLFGAPDPALGVLRNWGLRQAQQLPGLKRHFMRLAGGA
jgi:2-polyprenylphenol 6-hydroxylase